MPSFFGGPRYSGIVPAHIAERLKKPYLEGKRVEFSLDGLREPITDITYDGNLVCHVNGRELVESKPPSEIRSCDDEWMTITPIPPIFMWDIRDINVVQR